MHLIAVALRGKGAAGHRLIALGQAENVGDDRRDRYVAPLVGDPAIDLFQLRGGQRQCRRGGAGTRAGRRLRGRRWRSGGGACAKPCDGRSEKAISAARPPKEIPECWWCFIWIFGCDGRNLCVSLALRSMIFSSLPSTCMHGNS